MKHYLTVKHFTILFFLAASFMQSCTEKEPELDKKVSPTKDDVIGFWKLNSVTLDDSDVSFDHSEPNLIAEYFGFFTDEHLHHIKRYDSYTWVQNANWNLDEDLLRTMSPYEEFYKIHSFSDSKLVVSLNARQNLKLEFIPLAENDFPEVAFTAEISGEKIATTSAGVDDFGSTLQINGSSDTFFLAVSIPATATAGQQFIKVDENPTFGALIVKDKIDYGTMEEGYVKVIKRTPDYVHIEFEFIVKSNTGSEKLVVRKGSIRGFMY